jgi:hypothetical protein
MSFSVDGFNNMGHVKRIFFHHVVLESNWSSVYIRVVLTISVKDFVMKLYFLLPIAMKYIRTFILTPSLPSSLVLLLLHEQQQLGKHAVITLTVQA